MPQEKYYKRLGALTVKLPHTSPHMVSNLDNCTCCALPHSRIVILVLPTREYVRLAVTRCADATPQVTFTTYPPHIFHTRMHSCHVGPACTPTAAPPHLCGGCTAPWAARRKPTTSIQ